MFFSLKSSIPKTLSPPKEDKYILFALGFLLFETSIIFNQLEYLINSLTQSINLQCGQIKLILSNIIRFVVSGNLTESSDRFKDSTNQAKYLTRKMAAITDIDIMAVVTCYHNNQYIHVCFHHQVNEKQHSLTNPLDFLIGDSHFLGTSGQNFDDIDLQSTIDNRVQILEDCLKWSAIAPTRPNTLSCYPYVKNDPFIINDTCRCI
ncbi:unnamed protein product [Rotaria magnacalcarata]|uniref:DNA polymerase alpha/delta/epsilon subunit B domain-containing protein n=1 Tax=Rotaria magnacalcarata TaxID=392030 RepID=A0A816Z4K1_9BILA|nr:unnamed protein product [Rotaria magnacalcarata]